MEQSLEIVAYQIELLKTKGDYIKGIIDGFPVRLFLYLEISWICATYSNVIDLYFEWPSIPKILNWRIRFYV